MLRLFDSFRIGRFRGFRDVEFSGCGSTNLLIGANNSGKSSVLEALAIYSQPSKPATWLEVLRSRGDASEEDLVWLFSRETATNGATPNFSITLQATTAQVSFYVTASAKREIRLLAQSDADAARVEESGIEIIVETGDRPGNQERYLLEFWRNSEIWIGNPDRVDSCPNCRFLNPFSHRNQSHQLKSLSKAELGGWMGEVLDLLRMIDPSILGLKILTPEGVPSIHVNYKGLGLAPLSVLGDGIRRVVSIALTVANLKNGILLIDEIESAIHVSALETVFPWLTDACRRNNVQLFATTHSLEAIDSLLATADGDGMACFRLNRPDHSDRVERIAPDLLRRLRFDRGLDVRQAK